jgi:hypothetical protein
VGSMPRSMAAIWPPAARMRSTSLSASATPSLLKRSSFATAMPSLVPASIRARAASRPGRFSAPPETSRSCSQALIAALRDCAQPSICLRCSDGDWKASPSRPPTLETLM